MLVRIGGQVKVPAARCVVRTTGGAMPVRGSAVPPEAEALDAVPPIVLLCRCGHFHPSEYSESARRHLACPGRGGFRSSIYLAPSSRWGEVAVRSTDRARRAPTLLTAFESALPPGGGPVSSADVEPFDSVARAVQDVVIEVILPAISVAQRRSGWKKGTSHSIGSPWLSHKFVPWGPQQNGQISFRVERHHSCLEGSALAGIDGR
jgi:hypothetical protein